MNVPASLRMPVLDAALSVVLILFLVMQSPVPSVVAQWIDTTVGVAVVGVVALYLFFNTHPVLGVLSLIAAYDLLRRSMMTAGRNTLSEMMPTASSASTSGKMTPGAAVPSESSRTAQLQAMNPVRETALEEEVINTAAPIGVAPKGAATLESYVDSQFRPIEEMSSIKSSPAAAGGV